VTPDEFRRLGHLLVEWVASYRENISKLPVMSQMKPGEVRRKFPSSPPQKREGLDHVVRDLDEIIVPGITHWNHPRFFAYFPSNTQLSSILADLVISGLGSQGMSWQTSPAATEVEEVTLDWLRQMIGIPSEFVGVINDTASTATLVALLCARERTTELAQFKTGLQAGGAPLTVYASQQAHSSVEKAAMLAGFGKQHVRLIPTDENLALRPEALQDAIAKDLASGFRPCAIVPSVGTTATTAIDPVAEVVRIAAEHKLWVHVDAALAGTAMVVPECRKHWAGVEQADSLVVNPHKWMGVGFDCSVYYCREPRHLMNVMSTSPSYLKTLQDEEVKNYRDWGIPLGRRFRALKLWMVIRDQGVEGIQARVRRDLQLAQEFARKIDVAKGWERLAPVPFQTVCIRHRREGLSKEQLDAHNLALAQKVNATGGAYVTPAMVNGVQLIRVSIGSTETTAEDVDALWELLQRAAEE
jgi:aromatic-L-amino-acid/L-tryptophan decarboxylase